jgi:hypothetical protein
VVTSAPYIFVIFLFSDIYEMFEHATSVWYDLRFSLSFDNIYVTCESTKHRILISYPI